MNGSKIHEAAEGLDTTPASMPIPGVDEKNESEKEEKQVTTKKTSTKKKATAKKKTTTKKKVGATTKKKVTTKKKASASASASASAPDNGTKRRGRKIDLDKLKEDMAHAKANLSATKTELRDATKAVKAAESALAKAEKQRDAALKKGEKPRNAGVPVTAAMKELDAAKKLENRLTKRQASAEAAIEALVAKQEKAKNGG